MKRTLLLTTALIAFAGIAGAQTTTTPSTGGATVTTPPVQGPSATAPSVPSQTMGAGGATVTTPGMGQGTVTPPAAGSGGATAQGTTSPSAQPGATSPGTAMPGSTTPGMPSSPNVATAPNDTSPAAKAALKKIEADGYKNVQGLKKGADGMWQATAMRGGSPVQISVDAKGNVTAK